MSLEEITQPGLPIHRCLQLLGEHDNIAVQHRLVQRLQEYPAAELEFYIPQLVDLVTRGSRALETFLLAHAVAHPHFSVVTFWRCQAILPNIAPALLPALRAFLTRLQHVLFTDNEAKETRYTLSAVAVAAYTTCVALPGATIAPILAQELGSTLAGADTGYTRRETTFIMQLQNISHRLVQLPKEARSAALQAELALLNQQLPGAGVDIPQLVDHKIVRLPEAVVLSSAERAPFLLFLEYLRGDPELADEADLGEPFRAPPRPESTAQAAQTVVAAAMIGQLTDPAIRERLVASLRAEAAEETYAERRARIRAQSPWGRYPGWSLACVIVKTAAEIVEEARAAQLVSMIARVYTRGWVKEMRVVPISATTALVEVIAASSIHAVKRATSLKAYVRNVENFAVSLASYSILCYVMQVKDRHNGNIMVDGEGHVVHIDFGFVLGRAPGPFEAAPFKLTGEYVEILGEKYGLFVETCKVCFRDLRRGWERLAPFMDVRRLHLELDEGEAEVFVERLIAQSRESLSTRIYDRYQLVTQGILP